MNLRRIKNLSFTKNNKSKKTKSRKNQKDRLQKGSYTINLLKTREDFKKSLGIQKSNKTELLKEEIKKK